jgi:hypothetical protein
LISVKRDTAINWFKNQPDDSGNRHETLNIKKSTVSNKHWQLMRSNNFANKALLYCLRKG